MGGKSGDKIRKATGVYEDRHGITIRVRGKDTKPRWPLGTPLGDLLKARKLLLEEAGPIVHRKGTLADDVAAYLETLPADITTGIERRRRRSDAKRLLDRWLDATTTFEGKAITFRALPRAAITSVMIRAQLAKWRSGDTNPKPPIAPLSESTCDHLRRELGTLYTTLNGKEGYNPVRAVPKFNPKYDDPRGFDLYTLDLIIDSMPDRGKPPKGSKLKDGNIPTLNTAKVRLRVMRHCAIPPQTLRRVVPGDIDLKAKTFMIRTRRKGEGAKGRTLPLTDAAVDALREFQKHKLFGWFSQPALNLSFKRAARRYRRDWTAEFPDAPCPVPVDLHAYDLRHSLLTELYRRTRDRKIVAFLAGLAEDSPVIDRYVQAAVDDVARAAIAQLQASTTPPQRSKKTIKLSMNRGKHDRRSIA